VPTPRVERKICMMQPVQGMELFDHCQEPEDLAPDVGVARRGFIVDDVPNSRPGNHNAYPRSCRAQVAELPVIATLVHQRRRKRPSGQARRQRQVLIICDLPR
jgi:hypothetical protein